MSSQEIRISGQFQINMQRNWSWLFGIIVVLNVGKAVQRRIGRFNKQNNNFSRASHFFCTFLYRFCTTTSWKCLISHFMENVNRQRRNFISLSELGYPPRFPWNSASGGFTYIWQSKYVTISTIKTERTQIHSLSGIPVAVASLDLKVPMQMKKK